jgi:YesN/AraC family two-component response regulator
VSNVLIVEDNPHFRKTLRLILSSKFPDVHITEAEDGETALKTVVSKKQDLILMDIHLPGVNGIKVAQKIKERHRECRIMALTGYDTPEYVDAALRVGIDMFLSKHQTTLKEILDKVEVHLQG